MGHSDGSYLTRVFVPCSHSFRLITCSSTISVLDFEIKTSMAYLSSPLSQQPSVTSIGSLLGNLHGQSEHQPLTQGTPAPLASNPINLGLSDLHNPGSVPSRTPYTPNSLTTPLHDRDGAIPKPQLQ